MGTAYSNGITISNSSSSGNVVGGEYVGGFIGEILNTTSISNSFATGNVTSINSGRYVGGFIASSGGNVSITQSYASGNVSVQVVGSRVGGFIGFTSSTITQSYATGSVTTPSSGGIKVGGFVGEAGQATITDSYSTGAVSGDSQMGGFVGHSNDPNPKFQRVFSIGKVTGTTDVGGFAGTSTGTITDSYWNTELSGQANSAGGTAKTLAELSQQATFVDWDFDEVWAMTDGATLPWLRSDTQNNRTLTPTLTGTEGWRVMASPVVGSTVGSVLGPIWTQGFAGADVSHGTPNVYTWATGDGTKSLSNWTAVGNASDPMAPGQGMLVYVFRDDEGPGQTGTFPKVLLMQGTVPNIDQSLSDRLNPNVNGWALLGNPFTSNIAWNSTTRSGLSNSVYVYDPAINDWRTWNGSIGNLLSNGEVGAFNAFFVETLEANPTLEIPSAVQTSTESGFLGKDANSSEPIAFNLTLDVEGSQSGTTWFHFSEEGDLGLDVSDAKRLNSLVPDRLFVASESEEGTLLAINHLPMDVEILDIPLHFESPVSGAHELRLDMSSLPSDWSIFINDRQFGKQIRLTQDEPVYRFEHLSLAKTRPLTDSTGVQVPEMMANGQGSDSRFVIRIAGSGFDGVFPADLPSETKLSQNYPNPFNPSTTIKYELPEVSNVRLDVYDMLGRRVATLVNNDAHAAGYHTVIFDASRLSSGVYIYRLQAGSTTITRKLTLIK